MEAWRSARDGPHRVALLGFGLAGESFHAPFIDAEPRLAVTGVVVRDPKRRARAAARYPDARILDDADGVWADPAAYDLAVIATPNRTHGEFALRAIAAGIAVVVDKPMAASGGRAREMAAASATAGVPLTVFHSRRWDGDFRTLRDLIEEGRLGRVTRFESRFERWQPEVRGAAWERDGPDDAGGVLFDLGSHLADQALQLFGPVESVYAQLDARRAGSRVDDDTFVALTHASGVRSHLWMSALAAHRGPRMRVLGDRGAYVKYGLDIQEGHLRAGAAAAGPGWGEEPPERWGHLEVDGARTAVPTAAGRYQDFYATLADALTTGAPLPVDPAEAIAVIDVLEAAVRSSAEGRVVRLD